MVKHTQSTKKVAMLAAEAAIGMFLRFRREPETENSEYPNIC